MNLIEKQLRERLQNTFKLYVRHAIKHALNENETENDILQVIINLQGSLELLSKLYVLQFDGWKGIVDIRFHNKTEYEIISAIDNGTIKTTPYWKNKEFISGEIYLDENDKDLLDRFHNLRNQVMHLGAINHSRDILNEAIWFLVRIISQLNWQDTLPMRHQYLSNSLEYLLGKNLYNKLITSSCYVDEAVDRAYQIYDDIKFCIQCGNSAWGLNEAEDRICAVCGYRGYEGIFRFTNCPECGAIDMVVYDPLNIGCNEYIKGKCCACKEFIKIAKCPECATVFNFPGSCNFCEDLD